jgi:CheY-like chemotaxis protein
MSRRNALFRSERPSQARGWHRACCELRTFAEAVGGETEDILIVEDDPDLREVLDITLQAEGYAVATASDGAEALARLQSRVDKTRPRLILLDLRMPVMNGWQFRERQRQDPELAEIPVVVLSAALDLPVRASDLKADAYLPKPVALDRLLEIVGAYTD